MRTIIITAVIQFIVCLCCGQYTRFNNVYFQEDQFTAVGEAIVVRDNFEIISGSSVTNEGQKLFFSKVDPDGDIIDSNFIDPGISYGLANNILDFENQFLICKSTPPVCQDAVYSTYLAMINHELELVWQQQFTEWDDTEDCRDTWIRCMTQYNDDKAFIISRIRIPGNTNNIISPQYSGYKFVIMDQQGNTLHDFEEIEEIQTFKRYRYDQVKQLDGETFLVWGTVTLTADNPLNPFGVQNDQAFIRKINIYGDDLGTVHLGGSKDEIGISGVIRENGNCLSLYNHVISGNNFNKITEVRSVEINTQNMTVISETNVAAPWSDGISMKHVGVGFHNSNASSTGCVVEDVYALAGTNDYVQLLGYFNFSGFFEWYNTYSNDIVTGPNDAASIRDVKKAPDGGYYAAGYVQLFNPDNSIAQKPWLFKIDACGDLVDNGCPEFVGIDVTSEIPSFAAWPNPFHQELKANLPDDAVIVEWLDMSGRIIHTEQIFYPEQSFNLSKFADGNYMMRVVLQDGTSSVKRVVKQ